MIRVSLYAEQGCGHPRMAGSMVVALATRSAIATCAAGLGCNGGNSPPQGSVARPGAAEANAPCVSMDCAAPDASDSDWAVPPPDPAADAKIPAVLDASPYCTAQECGNAPTSGDAQSCSGGASMVQSACRPNSDGGCAWQLPPCAAQAFSDAQAYAAGASRCELLADGKCAVTTGSGTCIPLIANRYDELRGCYEVQTPVTLGCFAVPQNSPGFMFSPRTGCLEEVNEGERFLWFLPTAFLSPGSPPSYSPPFYLYAPGLQVCDPRFDADVSSSNGCSN
jgi:hypothetical protein